MNQGKGAAIRRGFAEATQPFVIVQDADLEYDPADYRQILAPLLDGEADVVFGSRFLSDHGPPGAVLLALGRQSVPDDGVEHVHQPQPQRHGDVLQGVSTRGAATRSTLEENRFGIEPEITAKIARGNWRVYEVGISYSGRTYAEGKKIGWRDGIRAIVLHRAVLSGRPTAPCAKAGTSGALADGVPSVRLQAPRQPCTSSTICGLS